jgi:hypothetical protein
MGFHPALFSLYFDSGMIYDLLAFGFFYIGLSYYLQLRSTGRTPIVTAGLAVIPCCLAGLDSKEIAVSFPLALLLFEVILFGREPMSWRRLPVVVATGGLAGAFAIARMTGAEAMGSMASYHPNVSLSAYLNTYSHYLEQVFFLPATSFRPFIIEILLAPCVVAVLLRSKALGWAAVFNLVSPLPILFISPRNAFAFFVPLAGWAIFCAMLLEISRRRLAGVKGSAAAASKSLIVITIAATVILPDVRIMNELVGPAAEGDGFHNKPYFEDLKAILPKRLAHRQVLALRHPFKLSWEFLFMLRLGWNDQTIGADTADLLASRGEEVVIDRYDYVVDFVAGHFVLVARQH